MTEDFKPQTSLRAVFAAAFAGLLHTLATQRNMKIHWISGFMVMVVGMALDFDLTARAALFFSVFLILFAEILNSALEAFVDLHVKQYAYQAKLAKDAAAAGVLMLAIAVVILFADILVMYYRHAILESGEDILRSVMFGVPVVLMLAVQLSRRGGFPLKVVLLLLSAGCMAPLVWHSRDPFFSLTAVGFVVLGFEARRRHPEGKR